MKNLLESTSSTTKDNLMARFAFPQNCCLIPIHYLYRNTNTRITCFAFPQNCFHYLYTNLKIPIKIPCLVWYHIHYLYTNEKYTNAMHFHKTAASLLPVLWCTPATPSRWKSPPKKLGSHFPLGFLAGSDFTFFFVKTMFSLPRLVVWNHGGGNLSLILVTLESWTNFDLKKQNNGHIVQPDDIFRTLVHWPSGVFQRDFSIANPFPNLFFLCVCFTMQDALVVFQRKWN